MSETTETPVTETAATEIIEPLTGECIDTTNADQLIDAYERIDRLDKELYAAKLHIRAALEKLAIGYAKTRRVRGERRRCKLTLPDDHWDQSKLKEAYHTFPILRDQCLAIKEIRVKLREWNKFQNESGPPDFETFKKLVAASNEGPQGLAKIEIEKDV